MAARKGSAGFEARLAAVREAAGRPGDADAHQALRTGLNDRVGFVVAAAAQIVADETIEGLAPELGAAFHRLLPRGLEADPGCRAKAALVRALLATGEHDLSVYRAGVQHVQLEPVFGGREDTAAELRAQCALGLVRRRERDAGTVVATLLADTQTGARAGAARAAAELDAEVAVPLLRFKLLVGDKAPEVLGVAWAALLALDAEATVALAGRELETADAPVADAVALALGESRAPGAFEVLAAWGERAPREQRQTAFVALTLLRDERATEHLLAIVADGALTPAQDALAALAHFRHDARLAARVRAAEARREDRRLAAAVRDAFGT